MSTLLFWLNDETIHWLHLEGDKLLEQGDCLASELPKLKAYREANKVVFLLTSQSFYVRRMSLFDKKISHQKAQEVLPLMLEEDFLDDVENMKCFPLDIQKKEADVVIFAEKDWLLVVDFLNENNIHCTQIVPFTALLPDWSSVRLNELTLIKTPKVSFCGPWDRAKPIVAQAVAQWDEPPEIHYDVEDEFWHELTSHSVQSQQPWWSEFNQRLERLPHDLTELLETYTVNKESESFVFFNLGLLAVILLVIGLGFKWHHLSELQHQHAQIQADIKDTYLKLYPDAKSVVAPKIRMQREIGSGSGVRGHFLTLLGVTGKTRAQVPGIDMETIGYEKGVLTLNVQAQSYESITEFVDRLNKQVQANQKRATQEAGQVKAQIEVMP